MRSRSFASFLLVALVSAALAGCASLSGSGARVLYSTKAEPPAECVYLADVTAGIGFSLFSQQDVKNALRNRTADAGGNFLVIDDITAVPSADGGYGGYSGTGRAMLCPPRQAQTAQTAALSPRP